MLISEKNFIGITQRESKKLKWEWYFDINFNSTNKPICYIYNDSINDYQLFTLLPALSQTNINVTSQYANKFLLINEGNNSLPNGTISNFNNMWTQVYATNIESTLAYTAGDLTIEGLNQIVNIKASLNLGLSDMLKSEFPGYTPVERPVINCDNVILDPNWISGFVSAEGNFDVRMPSTNSKLGYRVQLRFRISQHSRDLRLMEKIVEYFGSGKVYKYGGKSAVSLTIVDFTSITNVLVPFFNITPIIGIKLYDYLDWCKIHSLMVNRSHLTVEGINSIRQIKSGMNTGRSF